MIATIFPNLKSITWHTTAIKDRVLTHKTKETPILYSGRIEKRSRRNVVVKFDDGRAARRRYEDVFYVREVMSLINEGVPSMIVLEIEKERVS